MKKVESLKFPNLDEVINELLEIRGIDEYDLRKNAEMVLLMNLEGVDEAIVRDWFNDVWAKISEADGIPDRKMGGRCKFNPKILKRVMKGNKRRWGMKFAATGLAILFGTMGYSVPGEKFGAPIVDKDVKKTLARVDKITDHMEGDYTQSLEETMGVIENLLLRLSGSDDLDLRALGQILDKGGSWKGTSKEAKMANEVHQKLSNHSNQNIQRVYFEGADSGVEDVMRRLFYSLGRYNEELLELAAVDLKGIEVVKSEKEKRAMVMAMGLKIKEVDNLISTVSRTLDATVDTYVSVINETYPEIAKELEKIKIPSNPLMKELKSLVKQIDSSEAIDKEKSQRILSMILGILIGALLPALYKQLDQLGGWRERRSEKLRKMEDENIAREQASIMGSEPVSDVFDGKDEPELESLSLEEIALEMDLKMAAAAPEEVTEKSDVLDDEGVITVDLSKYEDVPSDLNEALSIFDDSPVEKGMSDFTGGFGDLSPEELNEEENGRGNSAEGPINGLIAGIGGVIKEKKEAKSPSVLMKLGTEMTMNLSAKIEELIGEAGLIELSVKSVTTKTVAELMNDRNGQVVSGLNVHNRPGCILSSRNAVKMMVGASNMQVRPFLEKNLVGDIEDFTGDYEAFLDAMSKGIQDVLGWNGGVKNTGIVSGAEEIDPSQEYKVFEINGSFEGRVKPEVFKFYIPVEAFDRDFQEEKDVVLEGADSLGITREDLEKVLNSISGIWTKDASELLGYEVVFDNPELAHVSREEVLANQNGISPVTRIEMLEGEGYVIMDKKTAICLSSELLMAPDSDVKKLLDKNEFSPEYETAGIDAYREIVNIINGGLIKIIEDEMRKSMKLSRGEMTEVDFDKVLPSDVLLGSEYLSISMNVSLPADGANRHGVDTGKMKFLIPIKGDLAETFEVPESQELEYTDDSDILGGLDLRGIDLEPEAGDGRELIGSDYGDSEEIDLSLSLAPEIKTFDEFSTYILSLHAEYLLASDDLEKQMELKEKADQLLGRTFDMGEKSKVKAAFPELADTATNIVTIDAIDLERPSFRSNSNLLKFDGAATFILSAE